jgi:hypothetical protein
LERLIGDLVNLVSKMFFTRASLDRGETASTLAPSDLAGCDPVAFILDLKIIKGDRGTVFDGLKLLSNLRQYEPFRTVPVFLVSDFSADPRLHAYLSADPSLSVSDRFEWILLEKGDIAECDRFKDAFRGLVEHV